MKNQVIKHLKKTLATVLAVSMLAGLTMVASAKIQDEADKNDDVIVYEERSDYAAYLGQNKAPDEINPDGTGKLFAGWFAKVGDTYKPLENTTLPTGNDGKYYAKFVPAQMLSVKVQNTRNTTATSATTQMKVLTGIDSLNYQKVGFKLSVVLLSEDGKTWSEEKTMGDITVTDVYWKLKANGAEVTPATAFGTDAAKYFATTWVNGIGNANFDKIVCITPYIITLDGATVNGLTKYAHVEDGLPVEGKDGYRWVNIPINVRDTKGVAAGVLKMTQVPSEWDCVEVECGKLFQEMDYAIKSDESVKLVGNLEEMTTDAQADTIYANVRFQVLADATTFLTGWTFEISEEDFANVAETQYTTTDFPVWDIKY